MGHRTDLILPAQLTMVITSGANSEKPSSMTPTKRYANYCPEMDMLKIQYRLYQTMIPLFRYSHFETVNLTCV